MALNLNAIPLFVVLSVASLGPAHASAADWQLAMAELAGKGTLTFTPLILPPQVGSAEPVSTPVDGAVRSSITISDIRVDLANGRVVYTTTDGYAAQDIETPSFSAPDWNPLPSYTYVAPPQPVSPQHPWDFTKLDDRLGALTPLPVPEPSNWALMALGLVGIAWRIRRHQR